MCLSFAHAQNSDQPFNVTLTGDFNYIQSFQLRSELKLARSTDFCRGYTIPARNSEWDCKRVGGGESTCNAQFKCALIKKGFSRKSETIRISQAIKNLSMPKKKFTMVVAKKPFKNMDRYEFVKQREAKQRDERLAMMKRKEREEELLNRQIKVRAKRLKNEMTEMDDFSKLEEELGQATTSKKQRSRSNSVNENKMETMEGMESEAIAADSKEVDNSVFENEEDNAELSVFENEEEKSAEKQSDQDSQDSLNSDKGEVESTPSKWKWLSFGAGMFSISDSEENSITTFGLMWSPIWTLSPSWAVKGNLSWHPFSAIVDLNEEAESFNIIEYGAQLEWKPFENGFYLSAGYGIQSWGSSIGGSFSALSLGGGYYFEEKKDRLIDYLFVKQVSVSNETTNVELVGGLGFIF